MRLKPPGRTREKLRSEGTTRPHVASHFEDFCWPLDFDVDFDVCRLLDPHRGVGHNPVMTIPGSGRHFDRS